MSNEQMAMVLDAPKSSHEDSGVPGSENECTICATIAEAAQDIDTLWGVDPSKLHCVECLTNAVVIVLHALESGQLEFSWEGFHASKPPLFITLSPALTRSADGEEDPLPAGAGALASEKLVRAETPALLRKQGGCLSSDHHRHEP